MIKTFENPIHMSVGNIESVRVNKNNRVKYEIAYLDRHGKEHKTWSNWMQDDGYKAGDSIPVRSIALPGTFGLYSPLLEVSGVHQNRTEVYAMTTAVVAVGVGLIGYAIGHARKKIRLKIRDAVVSLIFFAKKKAG